MPNYPDSDAILDRALKRAGDPGDVPATVTLSRDWLSTPDTVRLDVGYRIVDADGGRRIQARIGDHTFHLDEPMGLQPVEVAKPWGREIWLTGIEARGESRVHTAAGTLPLSQYLAVAPRRLANRAPMVLLKVLDPRPEPVLGDLYFEAHERKQEVYVVSHVDRHAWPDGCGGIRYGMNQELRQRYDDDDAFRRDYLGAVKRYEAVRRAIDEGRSADHPHEPALRAEMETFTQVRSLQVGDVVVVPSWLPHSLQHGVRVIEFQTPTYERYILSFAQQVQTQDHWDTEAAVDRIRLDVPEPPAFDTVAPGVERIVAFDDFRVWRVTLDAGAAFTLPEHPSYALCMVVTGEIAIADLGLGPEQAAFVPAAALAADRRRHRARLTNRGDEPAIVLVAAPDL